MGEASRYAHYELEWENGDDLAIGDEIATGTEDMRDALYDSGLSAGRCVWLKFEQDMISLSLKFPETTFCLYRFGELPGDIWRHFFKNGKTTKQKAKLVFSPSPGEFSWRGG